MARPRKYETGRVTFTISVSPELLDRINAQCKILCVNRSIFVVGAVEWLVDQLEHKEEGIKADWTKRRAEDGQS